MILSVAKVIENSERTRTREHEHENSDRASFLHPDREAGSLDKDLIRTLALAELFDQLYQRQISVQILRGLPPSGSALT